MASSGDSTGRQNLELNERFGGIKEMTVLPDLVFVIDVRREKNAVDEANKLKIPVVAVVDTNCDPDPIDLVIPSNDDAIRAIRLFTGRFADAILDAAERRDAPARAHPAEDLRDPGGRAGQGHLDRNLDVRRRRGWVPPVPPRPGGRPDLGSLRTGGEVRRPLGSGLPCVRGCAG